MSNLFYLYSSTTVSKYPGCPALFPPASVSLEKVPPSALPVPDYGSRSAPPVLPAPPPSA